MEILICLYISCVIMRKALSAFFMKALYNVVYIFCV